MEQSALISVIVPVYKVEAFLPRCVDSILAQTYQNLEVVLVDDGSPDTCGEICEEYAARDSRVKVIHKENGGLSSARNAGIDIARGEYLAFVDSDDWIEPETYETMLGLMEKYGVKLVCAGRYDAQEKTGEKTKGLCPPREEKITGQELVRRIFRWDNIDSAAWDKLYHRSLFRTTRYPNGMVVEDVPTTYRIALDAGEAVMCPRSFYNYFHRSGSITTAQVSEKTFHFSRHTRKVYRDIRENFPQLEQEARYLRVRSLVHDLVSLENAHSEAREKYREVYAASQKELRTHLTFLCTSPLFGKKERIIDLTLAFGVYGPAFRIYRLLKREETH